MLMLGGTVLGRGATMLSKTLCLPSRSLRSCEGDGQAKRCSDADARRWRQGAGGEGRWASPGRGEAKLC